MSKRFCQLTMAEQLGVMTGLIPTHLSHPIGLSAGRRGTKRKRASAATGTPRGLSAEAAAEYAANLAGLADVILVERRRIMAQMTTQLGQ